MLKNKAILICILLFLPVIHIGQTVKRDSLYVANWNMENLYDILDDELKNDEEFLPGSDRRWNEARYEDKLNNLVKVINYMNNGCGPDILAMEEVENINVVKGLIYKLRDRDYIVAHRNSPDKRGIDVSLIYDRGVLSIESLDALHVDLPNGNPTRDILHVALVYKKNKERMHIYVNHWPSRTGGEQKSNASRVAAAIVLKNNLDSLAIKSPGENIIILGDFNDEPGNESVEKVLGARDFNCSGKQKNVLLNLAYKKYNNKEGSYLFGSKFNMLDQIIISRALLDGKKMEYDCNSFSVIKPEFMIFREGRRKGGPIPTYEGKNYIGGFSDHFPVGAKFFLKGR